MVRRRPWKVTYFDPVPPRLARNTIIESTFDVGSRFCCTMRVDCGQLDPGTIIWPIPGEWHPHIPERLDQEELAAWRAGRNAIYRLAALTIGAPRGRRCIKPRGVAAIEPPLTGSPQKPVMLINPNYGYASRRWLVSEMEGLPGLKA
jgi:hypothetical protein